MHQLGNKDLEPVVKRLDDAIVNHRNWVRSLMRSLTCNLEHAENDHKPNAHRLCKFGQWYYGEHPEPLLQNATFQQIELLHKQMHQSAASMLNARTQHEQVRADDFDQFYQMLDDFVKAIEALKSQIQDLQYHRDPLTGAYSRATLDEELYQVKIMVQDDVHTSCLVMMDLDHFKNLNDTYGHAFGDQVLKRTSEFIINNLRRFDKLFRYGGEEFLFSLINTSHETAVEIAERMREGVAALEFSHNNQPVKVTASFGIAVVDPEHDVSFSLERADQALYQAKHGGRNRVVAWSADLQQ